MQFAVQILYRSSAPAAGDEDDSLTHQKQHQQQQHRLGIRAY